MATGDQADITQRLRSILPRWFGQDGGATPILDAFLQGPAWALAFVYSTWAYAKLQTRITTATDGWLDLIASDFFGRGLLRRAGQSDASYRALILASLIRERATIPAIIKVLQDLTGRTPTVHEGRQATATAAYSRPSGYGVASTVYGSVDADRMVWVEAFRPTIGSPQYGVSDQDLFAAVNAVRPVGTDVYMRLAD